MWRAVERLLLTKVSVTIGGEGICLSVDSQLGEKPKKDRGKDSWRKPKLNVSVLA